MADVHASGRQASLSAVVSLRSSGNLIGASEFISVFLVGKVPASHSSIVVAVAASCFSTLLLGHILREGIDIGFAARARLLVVTDRHFATTREHGAVCGRA